MMQEKPPEKPVIKPADLRGILEYVPVFREHSFVIALDGSIIDDENFGNVVTDIAVLRSLNIRVVLVHGVGRQLKQLAAKRGVAISDAHGSGRTDAGTLELAVEAAGLVSHKLTQRLRAANLRVVAPVAVRATEAGVLRGEHQGFTGRVEKVDLDLVRRQLVPDTVPLVGPIAFDREGRALRVNSDALAADLAVALEASKVIYLTPHAGLLVDGEVVLNMPAAELVRTLRERPEAVDERLRSKAREAARALGAGVPRAHILDGRVYGCLLTEIFDKVGLGTMVHANEYQSIRAARASDAQAIYNITRVAVRNEALKPRSRQAIEREIGNFYVYEIDESITACAALIPYSGSGVMELASVYVQPFYGGKGVGRRMVAFAAREAARKGASRLVALSTQSAPFFIKACGFEEGSVEDLPPPRREEYVASGRNSRVLVKVLKAGAAGEAGG